MSIGTIYNEYNLQVMDTQGSHSSPPRKITIEPIHSDCYPVRHSRFNRFTRDTNGTVLASSPRPLLAAHFILTSMMEASNGVLVDPEMAETTGDVCRRALAHERRLAGIRQAGAVMVILGIGATFSAFNLVAVLVEGRSGSQQVSGFRLPILVGLLIQLGYGMVAMVVGFVAMISAPLSPRFHLISKITVAIVNIGPISIILTIVRLVEGAAQQPQDSEFVPTVMNASQADINFIVSMGIIALIAICCALIGGLTVAGLSLCAFVGNQPHTKNRPYYRLRYGYYNLWVIIGGLSQVALAIFLLCQFGAGPYEEPIHITVYTVYLPEISIVVGVVQIVVGVFGWSRAVGWVNLGGPHDQSYLYATLFSWLVTMILQIVVQPSYGDDLVYNASGATYAAVYLGFFVMPAWLDYLVRHTPSKLKPEYFGLPADTPTQPDFLTTKCLRVREQDEGPEPSEKRNESD